MERKPGCEEGGHPGRRLDFFFPLVTRDNYCGIDQASRVLEQINCAVASEGGAQLLMEVVAGSSCCNVA